MGPLKSFRRAIMFSGGFDSMLIAALALRLGSKLTAVTVRFDDFNPITVQGAVESAEILGLDHLIIDVKAVEFLSAFEALAGLTDEPILDLDLAIVYAALKKYDPKVTGNVFISGMGSDQWMGDLALQENPGGLAARRHQARMDEEAHHRVAQSQGCEILFPFLSEPMLALSQEIPADMKKDKKLLRDLGRVFSIPHRAARIEQQVPSLMRDILIRTYGDRAWPGPVDLKDKTQSPEDQLLRQIVQGLWMEKRKG